MTFHYLVQSAIFEVAAFAMAGIVGYFLVYSGLKDEKIR
jgi:hypothetical protein